MHSSGSALYTILEKIRGFLDSSDLNSKYDNDWITKHIIATSAVDVLARIAMTDQNPIVIRHSLTIEEGSEYYALPPNIQRVLRIAKLTEAGAVEWDWCPEDEAHPTGPKWALEGNVIAFRPFPTVDEDITVWYTPNGSVCPHYSAAGGACDDATSATEFTLTETPTLGVFDRRENAYAGCVLRFLTPLKVWQERIIESYDAETRVCTLRVPITNAGTTTGHTYEIMPPAHYALWEAIAAWGAMKMGAMAKISGTHMEFIRIQYAAAIKTIRDQLSTIQSRTGPHLSKNNYNNPNYREPLAILSWSSNGVR